MEVYGKTADFDAGLDPIVRVDARRLRDKLRESLRLRAPRPCGYRRSQGQLCAVFRDERTAVAPALEAPQTTLPRAWTVGAVR